MTIMLGRLSRSFALLAMATAAFPAGAQSLRPDILWLGGGHNGEVVSVAYSPDGTMIGSAGHFSDSTIKLWRESDGRMIRTLPGNSPQIFGPLVPVTFFPDGKTVVGIGEGSAIGWWDVPSGRLMQTIPTNADELAVSRSGSIIAAATRRSTIQILRASDGALLRTLTGPTGEVDTVALSPDGSIAAGGDANGRLSTWRVSDGAQLLSLAAHPTTIYSVRFSPDGTMIATGGGEGVAKLWDAATGALIATLSGHAESVSQVAFSPDGLWLASASFDNTVRLWHTPSGAPGGILNIGDAAMSVAFNPSSSRLAVAALSRLVEYDVATQTVVRSLLNATQPITGVRFFPDGSNVISSSYNNQLTIWNAASGLVVRRITTPFGINTIGLSPDGASVAASISDRTIHVYRISDGVQTNQLNPGTFTYSIAFSPDGSAIASGQLDSNVRIYRTSDGSLQRTLTGHTGQVNGLSYLSNGSLLSASKDGTVRLWDAQGNFVRTLSNAGGELSCLAVSPDEQFALGGCANGRLTLWRISNAQVIYSFVGHSTVGTSGGALSVRFAPSGQAFYSGGGDGTMKVWRASDGALLNAYTTEVGGPVGPNNGTQSLDISPNGALLAYGRDDATVAMANNALIANPTSTSLFRGTVQRGGLADLAASDDSYFVVVPGIVLSSAEAPIQLDLAAQTNAPSPTRMSFILDSKASELGIRQEVWMLNALTHALELVDSRPVGMSDQSSRIDLGAGFARFIDASGNIHARVKWLPGGPLVASRWTISVDQAVWSVGL